jgi:hypothetical protein
MVQNIDNIELTPSTKKIMVNAAKQHFARFVSEEAR